MSTLDFFNVSGKTEITQFDFTVLVNQNVGWFNISMNESSTVNIFDTLENLIDDKLMMKFGHLGIITQDCMKI